jgi:hypothetical protein
VLACAGCNKAKGSMTRRQFEASTLLFLRRRVVVAEELKRIRRSTTYSHAPLVFGAGGAWLCPQCGSTGAKERSPTFVQCIGADTIE